MSSGQPPCHLNISADVSVMEVPSPAQPIKRGNTVEREEKKEKRGRVYGACLALYGRKNIPSIVKAILTPALGDFPGLLK